MNWLIRNSGLKVRASFRNTRLKEALATPPFLAKPNFRRIDPRATLNLRSAVYMLTCSLCSNSSNSNNGFNYIGETGRTVKERLAEHFTLYSNPDKRSEVANHAINVHGSLCRDVWKLKVLALANNTLSRKIIEAKYITKTKNLLNKNGGISFLSQLLFHLLCQVIAFQFSFYFFL